MQIPPSDEEVKHSFQTSHERLVAVNDYIQKRLVPLKPKDMCIRQIPLFWSYIRVHYWMSSLAKMNSVKDIQSVCTGTRSLLELAVDMVLLHRDPTDESALKIGAWAQSAQLKYLKQSHDFTRRRDATPATVPYDSHFIQHHQTNIEETRKRLWPSKSQTSRHPERWTGRRSLLEDVREADRVLAEEIRRFVRGGLEEFYECNYRRLNWFVHGSGYTGYSYYPYLTQVLYLTCSTGHDDCVYLGLLCSHIYLKEIDFSPNEQRPNPVHELATELKDMFKRVT